MGPLLAAKKEILLGSLFRVTCPRPGFHPAGDEGSEQHREQEGEILCTSPSGSIHGPRRERAACRGEVSAGEKGSKQNSCETGGCRMSDVSCEGTALNAERDLREGGGVGDGGGADRPAGTEEPKQLLRLRSETASRGLFLRLVEVPLRARFSNLPKYSLSFINPFCVLNSDDILFSLEDQAPAAAL